MAEQNFYRDIKFVDDHPSATDEFRGKPHHRVADTLISVITSASGGRAIGLEGTWGSGKSTVIDIARAQLESCKAKEAEANYVFFTFDAWAHQSDPLRRVFLQELIQHLANSDPDISARWSAELERIETRRKKITETKAERLSGVAKSTLLTFLLMPAAYLMINYAVNNNQAKQFKVDLPFGCEFEISYGILGALIILIPYVVAAATWLTWRQGWRRHWSILSRAWWKTRETKKGKEYHLGVHSPNRSRNY